MKLLPQPWLLPSLVGALIGTFVGIGLFTFGYGEGHAYLSDEPGVCTNCHVMQSQYDSWLHSSHQAQATCNDCHLPNGVAARWIAKADNGFFHAWAFTFQDFHEPIQIKARNLRILQDNCVSCHQGMVTPLLPETVSGEAVSCFRCHQSVGHGARGAGMPRRLPLVSGRTGMVP